MRAKQRQAVVSHPAPAAPDAALTEAEAEMQYLTRCLRVLADPTRLRIVAALRVGETCVCELASTLGLAENLVSHHLGVLRRLGLASDRRDTSDGRWIYYQLDPAALARAQQVLAAFLDPATLGTRTPRCPPAIPATSARARGRQPLPMASGDRSSTLPS